MVDVAEETNFRVSVFQQRGTQLQFDVFSPAIGDVPAQLGAVRHLGHQQFAKRSPQSAVLIENHAHGVAACVCGVIVSAIVVHHPVQELVWAVSAANVVIKEILANNNFPNLISSRLAGQLVCNSSALVFLRDLLLLTRG